MAEESNASRYVKLTKDHDAPMEEIRPGELNQPVHVPQLEVHRCPECGQPLPESYEPPADEPWTTGIFGCIQDTDSLGYSAFVRNKQDVFKGTRTSRPLKLSHIF